MIPMTNAQIKKAWKAGSKGVAEVKTVAETLEVTRAALLAALREAGAKPFRAPDRQGRPWLYTTAGLPPLE